MRKTDKTTTTAPKTLDALLAATSLTQKQRHELEDTASKVRQVQRRSTAQVFELGEHLERASEILQDELWERWVKMRCGFTARKARLDRAVFRNLTPHKDVLVELAVGSTALGKLSSAEPNEIEAVIAFAREHGYLKVSDVTAILNGEDGTGKAGEKVDPHDVGGVDGLKALIAIKVREGLKSFIGHCEEIQADVLIALAGKRIVKKELGQQTVLTARLARKELESLIQFVMPNPEYPGAIWTSSLPKQTHWASLADLLFQMGSVDSWPDSKVLRDWLEGEVVPALAWATSNAKNPEWLLADPKEKSGLAPVTIDVEQASATSAKHPDREQDGDDINVSEAEELAKTTRLEAAAERLGPAVASLGGTVSVAKPKASTLKRSEVAAPPLANEDLASSAVLSKKLALAEAGLPSLEEATRQTDVRMR